jgi:4-aminobutyrate aminotransferase / (S)-3-amino-2-methylpropionate transaminase / 5-aminovalerate transaminase
LRELRRLCTRHGIVLIADEIQTGFGRTGSLFAVEQAGIEPDLIAFAKSIAGGLPLAGVVGRASIVDAAEPGGLGGTFAGNPLACAAALATLDAFAEEPLLERSRALGTRLRACLDGIASAFPAQVADVRGLGAMLAIEFNETNDPSGRSLAQRVVAAAFEEGVILLTAGPKACALRLLVPLTATPDDVEQGCAALERASRRVLSEAS